jgi:predicted dehydrogenase
MSGKLRVLCVGLGNMGMSHAKAYARIDGYEVVALCERRIAERKLPPELENAQRFADYGEALKAVQPDVVSISTWSDSHAAYAIQAMEAGAHVFVEKPLADTVADAERVVATAKRTGKKLVIGYILRHHPSWIKFIALAKTLGSPLVFRMNLNQQSSGKQWEDHKKLLQSLSPIVDCGVHYLDVMCQITRARAVKVHALGARLTDGMPDTDIPTGMYNYGMLQVAFDDGSVGWYEAGWGPMMSEVAFFVKDVVGPKGAVSIVPGHSDGKDQLEDVSDSADIDRHTKTDRIQYHHAEVGKDKNFVKKDEFISTEDEPNHQELCDREQAFFLKAINEDLDLSESMDAAVNSLRIVLAAEQSINEKRIVELA